MEKLERLTKRDKWCYSVGGIGRDMAYTLIANFFLTYIQFGGLGLSVEQFATIGILLVVGRIWDAVNDPMMGSIIENTRSRWGKFKPWILIGAVSAGIVIAAMFNIRPTGWNFVIFFAVIYLLWEITFTMNDISYWAMLPSLSSDPKERDNVTTLAVVFAGVGAFTASALIPVLTVGNAIAGYRMVSIVIALFFIGCQCLTTFGVKRKGIVLPKAEKISIGKMFKVIFKNDQLLWITLAMLLYNIGSNLLVALGYNFVYMELGYNGTLALAFVATFGVSNIGTQCFYGKLVAKFGRKKLLAYSFIAILFGYTVLFLVGFVGLINIFTMCFFGVFVFSGQAIFYMILTVNLTNTIEYNESRTGERNEAVIFSLRPFMAKMGSALQQGIVTLVLTATLIIGLTNNVSLLEEFKNIYDTLPQEQQTILEDYVTEKDVDADIEVYGNSAEYTDMYNLMYKIKGLDKSETQPVALFDMFDGAVFADNTVEITAAADGIFSGATASQRFWLRFSVSIVPILLVTGSYIVLRKKYIIDEDKYQELLDIIARNKGTDNEAA